MDQPKIISNSVFSSNSLNEFNTLPETSSSISSSIEKTPIEPLLIPDEGRYVMFPIKHNDVWNMYKKQMDSFWRCEEINMSKDLTEWEKMNEDEKYFIKMVLAFFAASDGIVLENLAQRFMNDIENSEIRAFYSMQIFMENIHCVSGDTRILTKNGYYKIDELVNKEVEIWNGEEFTTVTVKYTGNNSLYRVVLSNGAYLDCTSKHKWIIIENNKEIRVTTDELIAGVSKLTDCIFPFIDGNKDYVETDPIVLPINSNISDKVKWLNNCISTQGKIFQTSTNKYLLFPSLNVEYLKELQLFFTTISVKSNICSSYLVIVLNKYIYNVFDNLSINLNIEEITDIKEEYVTHFNECNSFVQVESVTKIVDDSPTYCFNEPKKNSGVFNGILTGQSEMYSILIDTYSKNNIEKEQLFNAIKHFPCIKKKAEWAKKWINDKNASFSTRLVAFAIVEGIFFSSSFASIYWIKKRGMLHGLTLSNEFISRDEALHVEFAVLLYHKLINKLDKNTFYKIMTEAVEIEKEFILEAIPCRLIGMNSGLMSQYIEFVSNRLCLQMGYDKLYPNATNPFDFMELISLNDKVNFFEKTNTQYALANKVIEGDPFDLSSDF